MLHYQEIIVFIKRRMSIDISNAMPWERESTKYTK